MAISIGIVGAGEFGEQFAELFRLHPDVASVYVADSKPERAEVVREQWSLDGVYPTFDDMLKAPVDAVAIFTQRWQHGPMVVKALDAGKHVYSAVPMAISEEEIEAILSAVRRTGLTYMMGETSYYNPAAFFARQKLADGAFGEIFYAEGDYVHDIDEFRGFKRSGGAHWKELSSFPPMLYATHSTGGVLSVLPSHVTSVSALGFRDRGERSADGIFDRAISDFDNDLSNTSALFELSDGATMRINEMRRVGYPTRIRESRFRFFGTEGSFEQIANASVWQTRDGLEDVQHLLATHDQSKTSDEAAEFESAYAPIQDVRDLPDSFHGARNGHEGAHHFLVHEFVRSVADQTLPAVNAWKAARFTLPGIFAHHSAQKGGKRIDVIDFGDPPAE